MSTVPASSNVMLVGTMIAFFATCLVITFQAAPIWWVVPAVAAGIVVVIATIRYRRHRRMRDALHGAHL
jgi:predicted signal transduction protein with EAL and GGDEF domain